MPKEDPEDSKEAGDGAGSVKDKKAPPAKKGGKPDPVAEEQELSPEEMEKLRLEIEARELQNSQLQDRWNSKSVDEKFYAYAEDRTREPAIQFPALPAEGEGEEPIQTSTQEIALNSESLKELEGFVNDLHVRGCKVLVDKLVPVGGEDTSKGKAPAKGKPAGGAEEAKPIAGEAWLDLTPFMYPGATETV